MGSISNIVYYVVNYHCAKFGAFTINSTIISPFCWTIFQHSRITTILIPSQGLQTRRFKYLCLNFIDHCLVSSSSTTQKKHRVDFPNGMDFEMKYLKKHSEVFRPFEKEEEED